MVGGKANGGDPAPEGNGGGRSDRVAGTSSRRLVVTRLRSPATNAPAYGSGPTAPWPGAISSSSGESAASRKRPPLSYQP